MSKVFRTVLAMVMVTAVAACGGGGGEGGGGDSAATTEAVVETTAPQLLGDAGGYVIPAECIESDESLQACFDEGLIPDECIDEEGFIFDSCFGLDDDTGGEAAAGPTEPLGPEAVTSGFDPAVDAFSFPNYGGDVDAVNLTPDEMQRMFGDEVCTNQVGGCTLTPPARNWMEQTNDYMLNGRCEGMAVLSSLFYMGLADPNDFGAGAVNQLELIGNETLQREIAYWWATQMTFPASSVRIDESPSAVLDTLIETFSQGPEAPDSWSIGIFKRDGTGGHAVTPYAVEDAGDGIYKVFVYDNNYPSQGRVLTIDRNADTWEYEASINPSVEADLYEGDADTDTLSLHPASPRIGPQQAAFEEGGEVAGFASVLGESGDGLQVWLDGAANLLITALDGRRVGFLEDGTFVNEIDGATATDLKFGVAVWNVGQEPVYLLPNDIGDFAITIDGSLLEEADVSTITMIGPDFNMVIEDVVLDPGQADLIGVSIVDGEYLALNYQSEYSDSPDLWFGLSTDEADYEFIARAADIEPGGSFSVVLDFPNGDFILNTSEQTEFGIYELWVVRVDDAGEYVFSNDEIELQPDETMYVNFFEWEGDGSPMYLDFDGDGDGTIDDTIVLEDEASLYSDFLDE